MTKYKFGIIGLGNMAEAIISGAINSNFLSSKEIIAIEKDISRTSEMKKKFTFPIRPSYEEIGDCQYILLAVKPQNLSEVLSSIKPYLTNHTTLISIVTGITCKTIDNICDHKGKIIRTMPNIAVSTGYGVTAVTKGPRAENEDIEFTTALFKSLGTAHLVEEPSIDAIAAISGSGPAYFMYLIEAIVEEAMKHNLSYALALNLATETCIGSYKLLKDFKEKENAPEILRKRVTSPQGSTAAAISLFDEKNMKEIIKEGISAAIAKNIELGKIFNKIDK